MTVTKLIRYTTKPERADENEDLIRAVFAELAAQRPSGIRYAALRLDDGVSFVHLVTLEGDQNPLSALSAFAAFQSGIQDRCTEGPVPAEATLVGSYGLPPG
jgi:hypothetical protein